MKRMFSLENKRFVLRINFKNRYDKCRLDKTDCYTLKKLKIKIIYSFFNFLGRKIHTQSSFQLLVGNRFL